MASAEEQALDDDPIDRVTRDVDAWILADTPENLKERSVSAVDGLKDMVEYAKVHADDAEIVAKSGLGKRQVLGLLDKMMDVFDGGQSCQRRPSNANVLGMSKKTCVDFWNHFVPREKLEASSSSILLFPAFILGNSDLDRKSSVVPALSWFNLCLHYGLLDERDLAPVYECFFSALCQHDLRPMLCDILYKLTLADGSQVLKFRVNYLMKLRRKFGTFPELEMLLTKWQQLKPNLLNCPLLTRLAASRKEAIAANRNFGLLWGDRDSLMECLSKGGGGKTGDSLIPPPLSHVASSKRRRRRRRRRDDDEEEEVRVEDCKSVQEVLLNLNKMVLPCQALSLLSSPKIASLIILHPNSTELKERLSITLHHVLRREFFSLSSASAPSRRNSLLLERVHLFQDWLQQGLPVVGRFLSEFMAGDRWNGRDCLLDLLRLMVYLPLTDFEELFDCILCHLHGHYERTYNRMEQLNVLVYLHKLCMHWACVEYERSLFDLGRTPEGTAITTEFSNNDVDKGIAGERRRKIFRVFPMNPNQCRTPVKSIVDLVDMFGVMVDGSMAASAKYRPHHRSYRAAMLDHDKNRLAGLECQLFASEVLSMYRILAETLVEKKIPVCPELPTSLMHHCLFGGSSHLLSTALEYMTFVRNSVLPTIQLRVRLLEKNEDVETVKVCNSELQLQAGRRNAATQDVLLVLCPELHKIQRHLSTFKLPPEDSSILDDLNLASHPALLPLVKKFSRRFFEREEEDWNKFAGQIAVDPKTFSAYVDFLREETADVVRFVETFQPNALQLERRRGGGGSQVSCHERGSHTTSGFGSFNN